MSTRYKHIQLDERLAVSAMQMQGLSVRAIARTLGRCPSTISRELRRNADAHGYAALPAQSACLQRRALARPAPKLARDGALWPLVSHMLTWHWSPTQIARTLARMHPDDPALRVSHETLYTAIYAYPRGELRRQLIACLRQGRSKRRPRSGGVDRRGQIPEMVSIHVRPPQVNDRLMPGHWEGDLIKGAGNQSSVGVLVERSSRMVMLCKMPDATAASALAAFTFKLNQIAQPLRQTLTCDQGREMAMHQALARQTNTRVYFCDPHSPWQKGSCENTNGLLRQFLPKGSDLSLHDQDALDSIADLMNNRPRQTLNWYTPYQVFKRFMDAIPAQQSSPFKH
jgi:transposase, IS30 family